MEVPDPKTSKQTGKGEITLEDLISVVIPVFNVEKYLEKCLDSVTGQTYRNLEIILVDDGSTIAERSVTGMPKRIPEWL